MKTEILPASPASIEKAAALLNRGDVVALPTETVYGLAGNAFSPASVEKIFAAKERPSFDPLIVHVKKAFLTDSRGLFKALVDEKILSAEVLQWPNKTELEKTLAHFWPGPLTCIFPKGSFIPNEVTSNQDTVGLRMPAHPLFQAVLQALSFPLAAPSANRFGKISPTEAVHVEEELGGRIPAILDGGACSVGVESTIIRLESKNRELQITLLRPGKIGRVELEQQFGVKISTHKTLGELNQAKTHLTLVTPGMLDEHYAPRKPLLLVPFSFQEEARALQWLNDSLTGKCAIVSMFPLSVNLRKSLQTTAAFTPLDYRVLSENNDLAEMAHTLFATLRDLDHDPHTETIVIDVPQSQTEGLALAIIDRLKRASRNKPEL